MSYMTDQLLGDNQRLQDRIEELEANAVIVEDNYKALVEELEAEVERLNKYHDKFLDEFWKTNAENKRLQKLLDEARWLRELKPLDDLFLALEELEDSDGTTQSTKRNMD